MILVDTSVWIDYFRNRGTEQCLILERIIVSDVEYGITGLIYQEVLQGARTQADFDLLENYLGSQILYQPINAQVCFQEAARLYFLCRRQGVTILSSIDCLIARIAIENDLILLHSDLDYVRIAEQFGELTLYEDYIKGGAA